MLSGEFSPWSFSSTGELDGTVEARAAHRTSKGGGRVGGFGAFGVEANSIRKNITESVYLAYPYRSNQDRAAPGFTGSLDL